MKLTLARFTLLLVIVFCAAFALLSALPGPAQADWQPTYEQMEIDPARKRLYGVTQYSTTLDVYALDTLQMTNSIQLGGTARRLDLSPDGKQLAIALLASAGGGQVVFVNPDTLKVTDRILIENENGGSIPDDLIYTRADRLYVGLGDMDSGLRVYNPLTRQEIGRSTQGVGGGMRMALSEDKRLLYITAYSPDVGDVQLFDISTDQPVFLAATTVSDSGMKRDLCVFDEQEQVITSLGPVVAADLSAIVANLPTPGYEMQCSPDDQFIYMKTGGYDYAYAILAFDTEFKQVWRYDYPWEFFALQVDPAGEKLYFSTTDGIKVLSTNFRQRAFLPVMTKPRYGIDGLLTLNGAPAASQTVILRFFDTDYQQWRDGYTTTTEPDGSFYIRNQGFGTGKVYILYQNSDYTPGRLWRAYSPVFEFQEETTFSLGAFDIADIELVSPEHMAKILPPYTFTWTPRPSSPTDSYELNIFDFDDGDPYFYNDPPLGYTGSYSMAGLPDGFKAGVPYAWEVWTYSPQGWTGISLGARIFEFDRPERSGDSLPGDAFMRLWPEIRPVNPRLRR